MDVMSDFLVMAATLLKIKSKMLLPVQIDEDGEEIESEGRTCRKTFGIQDI